jgi:hypothetical protein
LKLYNRGKEQEQAYEREAMAIDSWINPSIINA